MPTPTTYRAADARVQAVIEATYERIRRHLIDVHNDHRRQHGLAPLVILTQRHHCLAPDRYRCPECGGRLFAEFEVWETTSGKPEETIVICEHEDWAGDDDHQHRWMDWEHVSARVQAWARANVRIL